MTLIELHNVMGDRINITLKEDLSTEQREVENEQTNIVVKVATQMINNGKLILEYEKNLAKCRNLEHSVLKDMIGE